ncbi:MAG: hypothetical protein DRI26_03955, partial [Chloroflexi bacterium]
MTSENKPQPPFNNIEVESINEEELADVLQLAQRAFDGIVNLVNRIKLLEKRINELSKEISKIQVHYDGKPAWIEFKWVYNKLKKKYYYYYLRYIDELPDGRRIKRSKYLGKAVDKELREAIENNRRLRRLLKLQRMYLEEYERLQRRLEKIKKWL